MAAQTSKTQLQHPAGKAAPRIATDKYEAVRAAILQALPADGAGLPFTELAGRVATLLPSATLARLGSVGWYTTAVKLDLEAQGLIERVPGAQPQCLRRA